MAVFIDHGDYQTIFCKVPPLCDQYGKDNFPVFVMYNDGSCAIQRGESYYRTKAKYLKKPRHEFTLNELHDIAHGKVVL